MDHGPETERPVRAWGKRKLAISVNTLVALGLATLLVFMINYLSYRHHFRMDWSRSRFYSLSDKTLSLLAGLTNRMDVVVFFQPGNAFHAACTAASTSSRVASAHSARSVPSAGQLVLNVFPSEASCHFPPMYNWYFF